MEWNHTPFNLCEKYPLLQRQMTPSNNVISSNSTITCKFRGPQEIFPRPVRPFSQADFPLLSSPLIHHHHHQPSHPSSSSSSSQRTPQLHPDIYLSGCIVILIFAHVVVNICSLSHSTISTISCWQPGPGLEGPAPSQWNMPHVTCHWQTTLRHRTATFMKVAPRKCPRRCRQPWRRSAPNGRRRIH